METLSTSPLFTDRRSNRWNLVTRVFEPTVRTDYDS